MFSVGFFAVGSQRRRSVGFGKGGGVSTCEEGADVGKDGADVGKDGEDVSVLRANYSLCRSLR